MTAAGRVAASVRGPLQVIEARRGAVAVDLRELWSYRELLFFLVWRDVKVRYKQAALGAAWALLQPLLAMAAFTLIFGRLAGLAQRTGGIPYPVYVYSGLLPWTLFASSITGSSQSVVGSANLVTKVYFPRIVIPLSTIGTALVDFGVAFMALFGLMAYYRVAPSWQLVWVPLFVASAVLAAAGVGTMLAALNVAYRDFQYVVPFLVQIWMFVTPVIYPLSIVPAKWRTLFALNPMTGVVEGFRAACLGSALDWTSVAVSLAVSSALFLGGALYFRSVERHFADII